MAKKLATLLALFLACYLGAHYYLQYSHRRDPAGPNARLAECDATHVRGLRIERKDGESLEFHRVDQPAAGVPAATQLEYSEWKWRKDPEQEADASLLARLASMLCGLYRPQVAEAAELGPSAGEAKLLSVVAEEPNGPAVHELRFGPLDPRGRSLVAYRDPAGHEHAARISPELLQEASRRPAEFVNLRVLRMSSDLVQAVGFNEARGERFRLERNGAGWSVSVRGKEIGAGTERAVQYVNRLGTLRALSAKPRGDADCAKLPYKIHLSLEGVGERREELYLNFDRAGPVQLCNTARPTLFEVHRDLLQYVDVAAAWLTK